jgi:hypothetical protein
MPSSVRFDVLFCFSDLFEMLCVCYCCLVLVCLDILKGCVVVCSLCGGLFIYLVVLLCFPICLKCCVCSFIFLFCELLLFVLYYFVLIRLFWFILIFRFWLIL